MALKDTLEKVPSWVWLGGAAVVGGILVISKATGGKSGPSTATQGISPVNQSTGVPFTPYQDGAGNLWVPTWSPTSGTNTSPSSSTTPTPDVTGQQNHNAQGGLEATFSQFYNNLAAYNYGEPGTADPYGGVYSGENDRAAQVAQQAMMPPGASLEALGQTDPAFQAWLDYGHSFGPGGHNVGNWSAWNQFVAAGKPFAQQYGADYIPGSVSPLTAAGQDYITSVANQGGAVSLSMQKKAVA